MSAMSFGNCSCLFFCLMGWMMMMEIGWVRSQTNLIPANYSPSSSCVACPGTLLYCPSSVGCGMLGIQGWQCYCKDWTWCRPTADCSIPQEVSVDLVQGLPIGMSICNASDANQWVIAAAQSCLRYIQISMNAIDEYDNPFVLTATNIGEPVIASSLDPTRASQSWLFENFTLSPLSDPSYCLSWNSTSVMTAPCDQNWDLLPNASNQWIPITGSSTLLSAIGTNLCLALYPTPPPPPSLPPV